MRIDARVVAVLCLIGLGLIITGLIIGQPSAGIEGAYFNRSVGVPAYSGVSVHEGAGLLDPADGNLWLGGGIVVLLLTALLLLISRGRLREPLSP
jgi:O-antigen ligase